MERKNLKKLFIATILLIHLSSLATSIYIFWISGIITALGFSLLYWLATPITMTILNKIVVFLYETVVPLNSMESLFLTCQKLDNNPYDSFEVLDRYRILRITSDAVKIILWMAWVIAALHFYN